MKISPVAHGSGTPGQALGAVDVGRSVNSVKMERARAIARGEAPREQTQVEQPVERPSVRSIKMRTNRSPLTDEQVMGAVDHAAEAAPEPAPEAVSTIPESTEEQATVEATQPLSPQFAALAKQKRALQVKERELAEREKALEAAPPKTGNDDLVARLKSQPLRVLLENGVTYDQLTEAILSGENDFNPDIQALREEIKSLKEGVDKTLSEREANAEKAALAEMTREAERISREGDTFELVRETRSVPKVIDLIHRTYKESGEILDVSEAMNLVEEELVKDSLRLASLKKVQGKLTPAIEPQAAVTAPKGMRTLTARDSAAPLMDRKARAMAAFKGTLKR